MSPPMLDLDAIEARAEAADPAPWYLSDLDTAWEDHKPVIARLDSSVITRHEPSHPPTRSSPNVQFIAHARADIPALVAELRAARADITEMAYRGTALSGAVDRLEGIVATQAAELRAAREVVEAAAGFSAFMNEDAEDLQWPDELLADLAAALAAYRAVVGPE